MRIVASELVFLTNSLFVLPPTISAMILISRKHIMTQNNDLLSSELNKWTKSMLVDYIVAQTLPAGVKLSDDLSMFLKDSSSDPVSPSHGNLINIANILQSVVVELKSVALSNAKLHDKLNHLNAAPNAQTPKSNAQLFKRPVDVHPNSVTGNRSTQPTNQLTASQSSSVKSKFIVGSVKNSSSKLSSMPVRKHVDIFVSRLDPSVTTALLESELFNGYPDVTISKMVTRHPSYSSFHIRLPADKLDIVLDPAFWPDGVMVKRFWGRLAPEMIQDATPKN
ncbi:hypothetical protein QTP88_029433 [Uroleucon formosanum]